MPKAIRVQDYGGPEVMAYEDVPTPQPGSEPEWIAEAKAHFDGEVLLATDLLEVKA